MTTHKRHLNLTLKIAIMNHSRTQRRFAQRYGFTEIRLSEIINNAHHPANAVEKRRISRALHMTIGALFPADDTSTAVDVAALSRELSR